MGTVFVDARAVEGGGEAVAVRGIEEGGVRAEAAAGEERGGGVFEALGGDDGDLHRQLSVVALHRGRGGGDVVTTGGGNEWKSGGAGNRAHEGGAGGVLMSTVIHIENERSLEDRYIYRERERRGQGKREISALWKLRRKVAR